MPERENKFEPFDEEIQGEVPPDLDEIPGVIYVSPNAMKEEESNKAINEFKNRNRWVNEHLGNTAREAKNFISSHGTGILITAGTLAGVAALGAVANEVIKRHKKKNKNESPKP